MSFGDKPAYEMTAEEMEAELARVETQIADGFGEHGGSPGEWWYERADELRHWLNKSRAAQEDPTP